jgi:ferritin
METNRLSEKITTLLNAQMTKQALASQIYLLYAAWAGNQQYDGIAHFLFRQTHEESNQ